VAVSGARWRTTQGRERNHPAPVLLRAGVPKRRKVRALSLTLGLASPPSDLVALTG
jgi:hypothetical protein